MNKLVSLFLLGMLLAACTQNSNTISLNNVGPISKTTTIENIKELFSKDSIVSRLSEGDLGNLNVYVQDNDTHLIYKKGGELLLSVAPVNPLDSVSKIKSVTVFSDVYKTEEGVGISSSFNDLNVHHNIEKLEATFKLVTVFVKDINATFTLDKQELGIKAFTLGAVDKSQIPENAKFTSMTVWFEE
ncbi:hypothetical protein [Wenyingzhuangia sp. 2_MG-2023]|uniref:hypothetical protein n=1 Tax=Wenyingzhuangia sp. 2_MG-2023 TaxID=3062639 RepID=UPI0026E2EB80|nr:hypothetical protein [Wenyingzhuangia sp. 2_MG-2023]MDO6739147.1 hypothetical protein [Wenyingzhuangia sp. 2_MG-2023]